MLYVRGAVKITAFRLSPVLSLRMCRAPIFQSKEMQHSELTAVPPDSPDKRMDMRLLVPEDDHDGTGTSLKGGSHRYSTGSHQWPMMAHGWPVVRGSSPVSPSMPPPSESAPTFEDDGPAPPPQTLGIAFRSWLSGLTGLRASAIGPN